MDLCSIVPIKYCSWMYDNPRVMLLTHLVEKYPDYVKEALNHPNTYKILDNSLIELGASLDMERLVAAAEKVKANEIILPDVFKDGVATINKAKESIEWLKQHNLLGKYKLNVVCHGYGETGWEYCFNILNHMPEVDVISIPKVTSTWLLDNSRSSLYYIFKKSHKEIHLLGVWYNLGEITSLGKESYGKIRSVDTCLPFLDCVQNKGIYQNREGTIDLEKEYPDVTKKQYDTFMDGLEKEIVNKQLYLEDW